jgi:alcohol dehydrogenase
MKRTFEWFNPVQVWFGMGWVDAVLKALGKRPIIVLAMKNSDDPDQWTLAKKALAPNILRWIDCTHLRADTLAAHDLASRIWPVLREIENHPSTQRPIVLAVGGGTVMDLAKLIRCFPRTFASDGLSNACLDNAFKHVMNALRGNTAWPLMTIHDLWLVPTTAGTGSEVTRWATLWDTENTPAKKLSFDESFGYAQRAFVDPSLTLSCPAVVTRDSGVDALSHALEALWNQHANPLSDELAIKSARTIIKRLPVCILQPDNLAARTELSLAALQAGLAFSQTRTALAHALSYDLTLTRGLTHGHSVALWLCSVWRLAQGHTPALDENLTRIFDDPNGASRINSWLIKLGIDTNLETYEVFDGASRIRQALRSHRGRNFIASATELLPA